MKNTIDLNILEDGTISAKTGEISDSVHLSADALMAEIDKLMGGHVHIEKNPDAHRHIHNHSHAHAGGHH